MHNDQIGEHAHALDTESSAKYLSIRPITLYQMRLYGTGPIFRKIGRRVVYLRKDLDSFLETSARRSTSDSRRTRADVSLSFEDQARRS